MESDLVVGIVLTALAFAGLMWAVFHGKYVVERIKRGEYPHHPNPDHSTAGDGGGGAAGPSSAPTSTDRPEGDEQEKGATRE